MTRGRALLATAALLALAAQPALGHATISPGEVKPGQTVALTVRSLVEREALVNEEMRIVVPRQWKALGCTAPRTWRCTLDRKTVAPHVVAVFTPVLPATPLDIDFTVTAQAPKTAGTYLVRTLQTHADGWVEPWVYDKEPYPAPRVQVGGSKTLVNGEGTREDPRCVGPTRQPKDYASHTGRGSDCGTKATPRSGRSAPAAGPAPQLLLR